MLKKSMAAILMIALGLAFVGPRSTLRAQVSGGPCWTVPDLRVVNGSVVSTNKQLCAPGNRRDCWLVPVIVTGGGSAVGGQQVICPPRAGCHPVRAIVGNTGVWQWQC